MQKSTWYGQLYSSTEPCTMCAGAIYWAELGHVVYALGEDELRRMTGNNPANPTLALPIREVFARGQRVVSVQGPALTEEARAVHDGFGNDESCARSAASRGLGH